MEQSPYFLNDSLKSSPSNPFLEITLFSVSKCILLITEITSSSVMSINRFIIRTGANSVYTRYAYKLLFII